ncbi:MAG: hypothetical protein FK732_12195 [Asgard group archaeon]|nr:hypothetical protein [Asgard group archaeon]
MELIMNNLVLDQLRKVCLEQSDKTKFSIFIGTLNPENSEVRIYSVIHVPKRNDTHLSSLFPSEDEINQFKALKFMLPYNLDIIGIAFYTDEEITEFNMKSLATKVKELPTMKFVVNVGQVEILYNQISQVKPVKLKAQAVDLQTNNLLNFIHTMEFETSDTILTNQMELKKKSFSSIDTLWDKITFNKDEKLDLNSLQAVKSPLDKIIEILIPCEDKQLSSKTEAGNVFLAFDLQMNFFISNALRNKKLFEIKDMLNKVLKQDLMVKLQRAVFDEKINRLLTPSKIPLKFFGVELNGYLLKDNPSKFEYNLCLNLIKHAEISALIGNELQARIFLRDLNEYFKILDDKEKQKEISELIAKLSN